MKSSIFFQTLAFTLAAGAALPSYAQSESTRHEQAVLALDLAQAAARNSLVVEPDNKQDPNQNALNVEDGKIFGMDRGSLQSTLLTAGGLTVTAGWALGYSIAWSVNIGNQTTAEKIALDAVLMPFLALAEEGIYFKLYGMAHLSGLSSLGYGSYLSLTGDSTSETPQLGANDSQSIGVDISRLFKLSPEQEEAFVAQLNDGKKPADALVQLGAISETQLRAFQTGVEAGLESASTLENQNSVSLQDAIALAQLSGGGLQQAAAATNDLGEKARFQAMIDETDSLVDYARELLDE